MPRPITLKQARASYPYRYTMEHVPAWARKPCGNGKYYAPQYRTNAEWYANTVFPGEGGLEPDEAACFSSGETWPLGQWLDAPYEKQR